MTPAPGLVAVHLLESVTGDRLYIADAGDLDAPTRTGTSTSGVFFAPPEAGGCVLPSSSSSETAGTSTRAAGTSAAN